MRPGRTPRATILIGAPGVGKSSIVKSVIGTLQREGHSVIFFPNQPARHVCNYADLVILGRYDDPDHAFPGTDRLSMGVAPEAIRMARQYFAADYDLLYEGQRLGNPKTIGALQGIGFDIRIGQVWCGPDELEARHEKRTQSQEFRSRATSAARNCAAAFPGKVRLVRSQRPDDLHEAALWALGRTA